MSGLYSDLPEEANAKTQDGGQFIEKGGWSKPSTNKKSNTTMAFKPRQTGGVSSSTAISTAGSSSAGNVATTSTTINNNHNPTSASMAFKPRQTASSRSTTSTNSALGYTETLVKKRTLDGHNLSSSSSNIDHHNESSSISYSLSDHMEASMRNQQHTPELNMSFEVDDPYDPSRPNDYLAYCEERLDQQRQKELAEENIRKFAEIERHREQMEKERAEAIQSGDVQRIQKVAMGAGWLLLVELILYVYVPK